MIQDYGFRIYNPTIGKFLSVDPLAQSYPMLTPYQFASNTPIQAIDLDGLEAFFIHGTSHGKEVWKSELVVPVMKELLKLTNNRNYHTGFSWKVHSDDFDDDLNHQFNQEEERTAAAELLADFIVKNWNGLEDITLIGYSHGGNVAIQAAKIIQSKIEEEDNLTVRINIITVNTPSYTAGEREDVENPYGNSAINDFIAIGTEGDNVAGGIALGEDNKLPDEQKGNHESHRIQTATIKERDEIGGMYNNHFMENVDPAEIKRLVSEGLKLNNMKLKRTYNEKE